MIREQLIQYFNLAPEASDTAILDAIEDLAERGRFDRLDIVAIGRGGTPIQTVYLQVQS